MHRSNFKNNSKVRAGTLSKFNSSSFTFRSPHSAYPSSKNIQEPLVRQVLHKSNRLEKVICFFDGETTKQWLNGYGLDYKENKRDVETMEIIVKENLKKLTYREKLLNIQAIIKNCRQLCQKFGYFYITYAMLFYDPYSQIKLSVWVHPDTRVTKCLHPIQKQTSEEAQLQFIIHLKKELKIFFPTIYFGSAQTFKDLVFQIQNLKGKLYSRSNSSKFHPKCQQNQEKQQTQKKLFKEQSEPLTQTAKKDSRKKPILVEKKQNVSEKEVNQFKLYSDSSINFSNQNFYDFEQILEDSKCDISIPSASRIEEELNNLFDDNGQLEKRTKSGSRNRGSKLNNITNQFKAFL